MKKILIGLLALGISNLHASGDDAYSAPRHTTFQKLLKTHKCEILVLKPFIFERGTFSGRRGQVTLETAFRSQVVSKILPGRVFEIKAADSSSPCLKLRFAAEYGSDNNYVNEMCRNRFGFQTNYSTISDLERSSKHALKVTCTKLPIFEDVID